MTQLRKIKSRKPEWLLKKYSDTWFVRSHKKKKKLLLKKKSKWCEAGLVLSLVTLDQLSSLPQVARCTCWGVSFPCPRHCMADTGDQGQLGCSQVLRADSPVYPITRSALLFCPDGEQRLLSHVMLPVMVRVCSLTPVTPGPALLPDTGSNGWREGEHHFIASTTTWQRRGAGPVCLLSCPQGRLTCVPNASVSSSVLPKWDACLWWGVGPYFSSVREG